MNCINLIGRLTADPEIKYTTTQKAVTSFTVAVDRMKDVTDFLPVVAWEKTAEFIGKHFSKGQQIGITGSLQSRHYEDTNGNKRTAYDVVAHKIYFCGRKTNADNSYAADASGFSNATENFEEITQDDLPF